MGIRVISQHLFESIIGHVCKVFWTVRHFFFRGKKTQNILFFFLRKQHRLFSTFVCMTCKWQCFFYLLVLNLLHPRCRSTARGVTGQTCHSDKKMHTCWAEHNDTVLYSIHQEGFLYALPARTCFLDEDSLFLLLLPPSVLFPFHMVLNIRML